MVPPVVLTPTASGTPTMRPAGPAGPEVDAGGRLSPAEELQVATAINASFQAATAQADSKVNMLVVVHPGATLIAVSQAGQIAGVVAHGGLQAALAILLTVAFMVCFVASGHHIIAALRPRTAVAGDANVFAFPLVRPGGATLSGYTVEQLATQAWQLAGVLAEIARTKYRHVRKSIHWVAALLMIVVVWSLVVPGP
ncbi:hypothetical protein ACN27J_15010 [Solwaraspora sp. WMMB762]|uniref:hypothetical protein n=1 Tax=Solwaraspora sp. WMMB762 TaxID=3404120 RepID=UPI003B942FD0